MQWYANYRQNDRKPPTHDTITEQWPEYMLANQPNPDRTVAFQYPDLQLFLPSVDQTAVEKLLEGENPTFSLRSYWDVVTELSQELHRENGYSALYSGIRRELHPQGSPHSGCSLAYLCRALPQLASNEKHDIPSRIATFSAVFAQVEPRTRIFSYSDSGARTATDTVSLIVSIALLSGIDQPPGAKALYSYLIGTWLRWSEAQREHFDKEPKRAITDRLVEFALSERRLVPLVAKLSKNWPQYTAAAKGLSKELKELSCTVDTDSDGKPRVVYPLIPQHIRTALQLVEDPTEPSSEGDYQRDRRSKESLEVTRDANNRSLIVVAKNGKSPLQGKIRSAIEALAAEPEWRNPYLSFGPGGKFENCSATLCGNSPFGKEKWGPSSTTPAGEEVFKVQLRLLGFLGFTQWHLLLNQSIIRRVLEKCDSINLDYDEHMLFDLLSEISSPKNTEARSLASALGKPALLKDPAVKMLSEWLQSLWRINKHLLAARCAPITVEFRDGMRDIRSLPNANSTYITGEIADDSTSSSPHQPKLLRISELPSWVCSSVYPLICWKNITQCKYPGVSSLCPFDSKVFQAVADIAREMNLAEGTVLGIDYEKFARYFSPQDATTNGTTIGSFDYMIDFESPLKGVALFYISGDVSQKVGRERSAS